MIIFCLLVLSYRLEITRKETAEECCYSYATISIDCHFRNAYRKVKELGMPPPIQQHQRLTSLRMAPLPYSCIPVCILRLSRSMKKNILLGTDKTFVRQMSSYAACLTWCDLQLYYNTAVIRHNLQFLGCKNPRKVYSCYSCSELPPHCFQSILVCLSLTHLNIPSDKISLFARTRACSSISHELSPASGNTITPRETTNLLGSQFLRGLQ